MGEGRVMSRQGSVVSSGEPRGTDRPFVSAVFPNFNGGSFLTTVIDALLHQQYPRDRFEILMVDNGSTDGSVALVKTTFSEAIAQDRLKIFELPENRGCSAGYNYGIARMSPQARYLLRVDDDLVLDANCLAHLVRRAEQEPSVGAVGGKVRYYQDRQRLHLIGSRISPWFGACRGIGKHVIDRGQYDTPRELQAVNGCLMLVRRDVFERIGPIEESFFLYFEDIDWALRATRAGFRHYYVPEALAYHDTATPSQRYCSTRWGYFNICNTCYLAKRNFTKTNQVICWGVLSVKMLCYLPFVLFYSRWRSPIVLRSMWLGYRRGTALLFGSNGASTVHHPLHEVLNG